MTTSNVIASASHRTTNKLISKYILERINTNSKVLDFGAGRGYMSQEIGSFFKKSNKDPRQHLFACEIDSKSFEYTDIDCLQISTDSKIPFEDNTFDLIYSIEVLEHTPRPYDFLDEAYRKLKKGGWLIFSVPNILHFQSRLKFLFSGYGEMFGPLSSDMKNAGRICGHIMPLNYGHFNYGLKKSGFKVIEYAIDRRKKGAIVPALLFYPFLKLSSFIVSKKTRNNDIELWEENKEVIKTMNSLDILSSRSCIMLARK
jgi:SAM-dependent methyltransferase